MASVRKGWPGGLLVLLAVVAAAVTLALAGPGGTAIAETAGHGAPAGEHAVEGHGAEGHGADGGAHGAHGGVTRSQVMNFIWHCLNFSILALVLVKFLRKPITEGLKGRTESIRSAFEDLEAKRAEAERKYAEYERKLAGMDAEAERILATFVEQGQAEKQKIIAQAHDAAERIKAQAELYVQQELAKARSELQGEVAVLAVKMAEDLVRKNLTEQDHHRLISEYLERVVTKN